MLEEHILKELRKVPGMFANRNIISSRKKKTGNRKRKCVRSVSEPCSSSKCLRLFSRGDNIQSFEKTVFNYQAEIFKQPGQTFPVNLKPLKMNQL